MVAVDVKDINVMTARMTVIMMEVVEMVVVMVVVQPLAISIMVSRKKQNR